MKEQTFIRLPNTGRHIVRYNGAIHSVAPGDTVICTAEALGSHIKNYKTPTDFIKIEPEIVQKFVIPVIVNRSSSSYCDICNPLNLDKPLNSKALRRKEAEEIVGQYVKMYEDGKVTNISAILKLKGK